MARLKSHYESLYDHSMTIKCHYIMIAMSEFGVLIVALTDSYEIDRI